MDNHELAGAPESPLFEIRHTKYAGRAVYAACDMPAGTPIWRADDLALSVLLRDYRREVCGQCFDYDHGRILPIRDPSVGFVFCSKECQEQWKEQQGDIGVQAWTAVEKLVKGRSQEDSDMVDIDLPRPKPKEITEAWESVADQAALIRIAREAERGKHSVNGVLQPKQDVRIETIINNINRVSALAPAIPITKQHRRAVQKALTAPISPDVMSFCVSGLITAHHHPTHWPRILSLAIDPSPYHNTADLVAFTRTYLHLLSILPLPLLPYLTPETLYLLSTRDSHNSFGIRSLGDEGSEFFGYGCWPTASWFNHSCAPNVEKRREGRTWVFGAWRDVRKGEELCISYLSGEERGMSCGKRRERLARNWGFECGCERCGEGEECL